ncbi:MAG TPA: glutaredoxin domain-containing protein [Candidatus Saccharimonadales bacterium]
MKQNDTTEAKSARPTTIIYGAEWCSWCHTAIKYFEQKGISYIYHDIEKEEAAYNELVEKLSGPVSGVPVLDVNGEIIVGYDLGRINEALANK